MMDEITNNFVEVFSAIERFVHEDGYSYHRYLGVYDMDDEVGANSTFYKEFLDSEEIPADEGSIVLKYFKELRVYQYPGGGIGGDSYNGMLYFGIDGARWLVVEYYT